MKLPKAFALANVLLVLPALIACSDNDDEEERVLEYAPVRAYAGFRVETQQWLSPRQQMLVVVSAPPGTPAAAGGLLEADVVRRVGGRDVVTAQEVYAAIEARAPGDSIALEVERFYPREFDPTAVDCERLSLTIQLVGEPLPGGSNPWVPPAALRLEDHQHLGLFLSDITRPLADHFQLGKTPGVLVVQEPFPFTDAWDAEVAPGDVITSFAGTRIYHLADLQRVINQTPENKRVRIEVRRGQDKFGFVLQALGPEVAGINFFPPGVRKRVKAALDSGSLHPDHVPMLRVLFRRQNPKPGDSTSAAGTIERISSSSITTEVFSTGRNWTLKLSPGTMLAGPGATSLGLKVGDFVEIHTRDGTTALLIFSKVNGFPAP
jgi:hypothetical protein